MKQSLNIALEKRISCRFEKSLNSGNCKHKKKLKQQATFNTDVSCLTQSSHVTYAGVDPVSPGLFDVWVDKNVPPWAPLRHHDHHHLHLYYHDHVICITMIIRPPSPATSTCTLYYHHQHHYLFPYSQVKTFEITTSPAKHGNLAFCFRHCCLTCVHFRFYFSNRVLKSESTRQRWHQPGICKTKPLHGQSCSYQCDPGFTILGSTSTTCDNGHWTQGAFQCQGKPWAIT